MVIEDGTRGGIDERRAELLLREGTRFVDLEEFQTLLLSRRLLRRFADLRAYVSGLLDEETGELFLIEEDRLPRF